MQPAPTCGAKTRAGTPCRRPAGFATPHFGRGKCRAHGGLAPRAVVAAERAELLAEAKRWADDHDADPGELMLGLVRATAAHAALVERRLREREADTALLLWHRLLESTQRTAADVAARALSLGLEERQQRLAERQADVIAAAITDGLREAFGDLATVERRTVFARVVQSQLLVLESLDAEELEQLRDPTPTLTGGST